MNCKKVLTISGIMCLVTIVVCVVIWIIMYKSETFKNESNCEFVSSRGIMKSCDVYPPKPVSSTNHVYEYNWEALKTNAIVYIHGSAVPEFIDKAFKKIAVPFVLVTGDCDESIPTLILSEEKFRQFIEDERVIHWFSQNAVIFHPKLTCIPIGMDYHTLSEQSTSWGEKSTPMEQELLLKNIRQQSLPLKERTMKCYSNFHFSMNNRYGSDRIDAKTNIPSDCIYYEPHHVNRKKTWENQSQFAFVISPHGEGYDCHRTWESLFLGCIPIVKESPISILFKNLPVLVVKDWSDVNLDLLEYTVNTFSEREWDLKKLTLEYWVKTIKDKTNIA